MKNDDHDIDAIDETKRTLRLIDIELPKVFENETFSDYFDRVRRLVSFGSVTAKSLDLIVELNDRLGRVRGVLYAALHELENPQPEDREHVIAELRCILDATRDDQTEPIKDYLGDMSKR